MEKKSKYTKLYTFNTLNENCIFNQFLSGSKETVSGCHLKSHWTLWITAMHDDTKENTPNNTHRMYAECVVQQLYVPMKNATMNPSNPWLLPINVSKWKNSQRKKSIPITEELWLLNNWKGTFPMTGAINPRRLWPLLLERFYSANCIDRIWKAKPKKKAR